MNDTQQKRLTQITIDFKIAYECFLRDQGLKDTHVTRAGFYLACAEIVRRDPLLDDTVQKALVNYIDEQAQLSASKALVVIDKLINDLVVSDLHR